MCNAFRDAFWHIGNISNDMTFRGSDAKHKLIFKFAFTQLTTASRASDREGIVVQCNTLSCKNSSEVS